MVGSVCLNTLKIPKHYLSIFTLILGELRAENGLNLPLEEKRKQMNPECRGGDANGNSSEWSEA